MIGLLSATEAPHPLKGARLTIPTNCGIDKAGGIPGLVHVSDAQKLLGADDTRIALPRELTNSVAFKFFPEIRFAHDVRHASN